MGLNTCDRRGGRNKFSTLKIWVGSIALSRAYQKSGLRSLRQAQVWDRRSSAGAKIAPGVINTVAKGVTTVASKAVPIVSTAVKKAVPVVGSAINKAVPLVEKVAAPVVKLGDKALTASGKIIDGAGNAASGLGGLLGGGLGTYALIGVGGFVALKATKII